MGGITHLGFHHCGGTWTIHSSNNILNHLLQTWERASSGRKPNALADSVLTLPAWVMLANSLFVVTRLSLGCRCPCVGWQLPSMAKNTRTIMTTEVRDLDEYGFIMNRIVTLLDVHWVGKMERRTMMMTTEILSLGWADVRADGLYICDYLTYEEGEWK